MLAGFWFADPQLRMLAAAPMDRQDDLARRLVDIGDDVGNEGPQEPLASAHADDWRVPGGFEIVGESSEIRHDRRSGPVFASPPAAPRMPPLVAAPLPSSSRAARRSTDCRDRRQRSAARRARPRSGPAAVPAQRCVVFRPGSPYVSARLAMPPQSPSALQHEGPPRRSPHRCEGLRRSGIAAAPASGWDGRTDKPAGVARGLRRRPRGAARSVRTSAILGAAPVRPGLTWCRRPSRKHWPRAASGCVRTLPNQCSLHGDPSAGPRRPQAVCRGRRSCAARPSTSAVRCSLLP